MNFEIRTARPEDQEAIVRLVNSAYRGDHSRKGWTYEADLIEGDRIDSTAIAKIISSAGDQCEQGDQCKQGDQQARGKQNQKSEQAEQIELAVTESGTIIGCVHLKREPDQTLFFGMLTVEPTLQASGLGKRLMTHIETIAIRERLRRIRLTVITVRKELISYYERRGFVFTGKTEPFLAHAPNGTLVKDSDMQLAEYVKQINL